MSLDMYSRKNVIDSLFNTPTSVISNEEQTVHMYTCGNCTSWSYQDTLFTDYFSCEQCGHETTKLHHVVLKKAKD